MIVELLERLQRLHVQPPRPYIHVSRLTLFGRSPADEICSNMWYWLAQIIGKCCWRARQTLTCQLTVTQVPWLLAFSSTTRSSPDARELFQAG